MVIFEEEIVSGSEGNFVVVCARAMYPLAMYPPIQRFVEGALQLTVDISVVDQGSAGMATRMYSLY